MHLQAEQICCNNSVAHCFKNCFNTFEISNISIMLSKNNSFSIKPFCKVPLINQHHTQSLQEYLVSFLILRASSISAWEFCLMLLGGNIFEKWGSASHIIVFLFVCSHVCSFLMHDLTILSAVSPG